MASPGELMREIHYALLADPVNGLNPAFLANCQKRGLVPPMPGTGAGPFDFSPDTQSVFRMDAPIDWIEQNSELQYPAILTYVKSVQQEKGERIFGIQFQGEITIETQIYLAWYINQLPAGNNFEAHLDALEESVIAVLNNPDANWVPVLYENMVDIPERYSLALCNSDQLARRGLKVRVTGRIIF